MKRTALLWIAVILMLMGCAAGVPDDSTPATNAPSTVSTTGADTEPTTLPTAETQAPTEVTTVPTEPVVNGPRQDGLRLSEEELEYFDGLFVFGPHPGEFYYNLVLDHNFASVQDIWLIAFFEDGSPEDMKEEITQSECDYYNNALDDAWSYMNIDRLSYDFINDVFQRYLGLSIPEMNMSTLVYNPATGYYYRAGSATWRHENPDFTDGYYDEETGLISLYFMSTYPTEERIVTLRYKPEAEVTKFQIVSCLPEDGIIP